jgi:hypothetical protein
MPTIEIISVQNDDQFLLNQKDYPFAIIQEKRIKSHRGLFCEYLNKYQGSIIHIGNPDFIDDYEGFFFAGNLINWEFESKPELLILPSLASGWNGSDQSRIFQFKENYYPHILGIIRKSLQHSEQNLCFFLTDYQFGPKDGKISRNLTLAQFDQVHNSGGLKWNCLYRLIKGQEEVK